MPEGDGRIEARGETLLHSEESWQARRLFSVFNLQGSEIIVILLLALVVLGPEKLPDAIRKFSRTYAELKKMGSGFQSELKSALDEPMREMRETGDMLRDAADPSRYPSDDGPGDRTIPADRVDDDAAPDDSVADEVDAGRAGDDSAGGDLPEREQGDADRAADEPGADAALGGGPADAPTVVGDDPGSLTVATPGDPPPPTASGGAPTEARDRGDASAVATDGDPVSPAVAAGNGAPADAPRDGATDVDDRAPDATAEPTDEAATA